MTTWLITGCSSGLGRALAEAVLARGDNAAVTARDVDAVKDLVEAHPELAIALPLDVTDPAAVATAVARAQERFGGVDVLVNNAGYGYRSAVEEGGSDDVERLFATNVFGPVELIKAVLPGMRERRRGAIVNISSIAAHLMPAGSGYYAASKAALEGLTGSLRAEVGPLGIKAFVVEPGAFRTEFAGRSLIQSETVINDYAETAGKRRIEQGTGHGTQPGDPAKAAAAILEAVDHPEPPALLLLGTDAVTVVTRVLDTRRAGIDSWKELSFSTDIR